MRLHYYLTYKAKEFDYHAQIINSGRALNDSMGAYVAKETVKKIISADKNINGANILVMGITFKEDVTDIRNSKVVDVIEELKSYKANVDIVDPHACNKEVEEEYGYIIEPDLIRIEITKDWIKEIEKEMPELADDKLEKFTKKHKIAEDTAKVLAVIFSY